MTWAEPAALPQIAALTALQELRLEDVREVSEQSVVGSFLTLLD